MDDARIGVITSPSAHIDRLRLGARPDTQETGTIGIDARLLTVGVAVPTGASELNRRMACTGLRREGAVALAALLGTALSTAGFQEERCSRHKAESYRDRQRPTCFAHITSPVLVFKGTIL